MPKYKITGPDGQSYEVNAPDGATEQDVLAYAQRSFKMAKAPAAPEKGLGEQINDFTADLPRQVGRAGRAALEGVGGAAEFITSPIRGALNSFIGGSQERANRYRAPADRDPLFQFGTGAGGALADSLGLPKPQNGTERIVDGTIGAMAGGVIPMAAGAQLASRASGAARGVGEMLAANPAQQMASAAGGGAAGGYTRETGGDDRSQLIASLVGGFGAPAAMNAGQRMAGAAARTVGRIGGNQAPSATQVDVTINNALRSTADGAGVGSLDQLAPQVAQSLRADVAKALTISDTLDPAAVRRLADYHATGLTPTQARLSLDPADITRQANLAKQGANSTDPAAQALSRTQNANNRQLTTNLNTLGANTADDAVAGASKIMGGLQARDSAVRDKISARYDAARSTEGRSALLDHQAFADRANALLDSNLLGGKLPSDVRNVINKKWAEVVEGGTPAEPSNAAPGLSVDAAEQIKTRIADLQRSSSDGAERKALGLVRQALEETPLAPGQEIGADSIRAFNSARTLNRRYMKIVEATPALQAVRDGVQPDKFVNDYIISGGSKASVMDVAKLKNSIKGSDEAMQAVRDQIVAHLKNKALNGAPDEVGNFSQSAYRNALNAIGDRKLMLFFKPEDIAQLRAVERAASYEQFQPVGSAVNNSNSAAGIGSILDRIGSSSLLSKIPLGRQIIGEPAQNIAISMRTGRALDTPRALTLPPTSAQAAAPLPYSFSPNIFAPQETEEQKIRRLMGLQ